MVLMKTNRGVMAATAVVLMMVFAALMPMIPSSDATSEELDIVSVDYNRGVVSYSVETTSPYIYVIILDENGAIQYLGPSKDVNGGVASGSFVKILNPGNYVLKVLGNKSNLTDTKAFTVYLDLDVPYLKAMVVGERGTLDYTIVPDDTGAQAVLKSSNPEVVLIDNDGTLIAVSAGVAFITVTVDGMLSKTCCVTVSESNGSFIKVVSADYYEGKVYFSIETDCPYLYLVVLDQDGNVMYMSSNPTVKNGKVESSFVKTLEEGKYILYVRGPDSSVNSVAEFNTVVGVTGIDIETPHIGVGIGVEINPSYSVLPWNATNKDVYFTTSDSSVVKIDDKGKIIAVGLGSALIEIISKDSGVKTSFVVDVLDDVGTKMEIKSVSYKEENISFSVDTDCKYIYVQILDMNGNIVCFGPSRTVENGHIDSSFVRHLADGEYILHIQGERSEVNHSMQFKVGNTVPVSDIVLDKKAISAVVGDRFDLNATILPENATDKTVSWIISDESVISRDADGRFTAKQSGMATIVVKAGNYQAECIVVVEGKGTAVSNEDGSVTTTVTDKIESEDGTTTEITTITDKKDGEVAKKTEIVSINDEKSGISSEAKRVTDADGNEEATVVSKIDKTDITADDVDKAISQAKAASAGMDDCKVTLKIEDSGNGVTSINKDAVKAIGDVDLEISFDDSSVILNESIINNLSDGSIRVSSGVPKNIPSVIGVSMIVAKEFNLSVGETDIHELGGKMTLTIDCELPEGCNSDDIRAWYVDDDGLLTLVPCVWKDGKACIEVTHLSTYVVGIGETEYSVGKTAAFLATVIIGIVGIAICLTYPFVRRV